jgi:hypothetical protein
MAGHGISWILGVHVRFVTLDFVVTMEGELVQALAPAQPPLTIGPDAIDEALEELHLDAPKARAPGCDQLLDFDFGRLEHQLAVFQNSIHPRRTYITSPFLLSTS